MVFCDRSHVASVLKGKRVAIVGSGPGVMQNPAGKVDGHDVVVRVNNFQCLDDATGFRTDVFYSFFGLSIRKSAQELIDGGVKLCMAKCPDVKFIESAWHERNGKQRGVDFRLIYQERKDWWFCPTYVPTHAEFMRNFELLNRHVPTTGFAAILDVLSYGPAHVFLTGFDFFQSRIHNVNEPWAKMNHSDPIGHDPDGERQWLRRNMNRIPVELDAQLELAIRGLVQPDSRASQIRRRRIVPRKLIKRVTP